MSVTFGFTQYIFRSARSSQPSQNYVLRCIQMIDYEYKVTSRDQRSNSRCTLQKKFGLGASVDGCCTRPKSDRRVPLLCPDELWLSHSSSSSSYRRSCLPTPVPARVSADLRGVWSRLRQLDVLEDVQGSVSATQENRT